MTPPARNRAGAIGSSRSTFPCFAKRSNRCCRNSGLHFLGVGFPPFALTWCLASLRDRLSRQRSRHSCFGCVATDALSQLKRRILGWLGLRLCEAPAVASKTLPQPPNPKNKL